MAKSLNSSMSISSLAPSVNKVRGRLSRVGVGLGSWRVVVGRWLGLGLGFGLVAGACGGRDGTAGIRAEDTLQLAESRLQEVVHLLLPQREAMYTLEREHAPHAPGQGLG